MGISEEIINLKSFLNFNTLRTSTSSLICFFIFTDYDTFDIIYIKYSHIISNLHNTIMESISVALKASKDIENVKNVVITEDDKRISETIIDKQNNVKKRSRMNLTICEIFMLR